MNEMMDLEIDCPHCSARAGEICKINCGVNGEKIDALESILIDLDLTLKDVVVQGWGVVTNNDKTTSNAVL